MIEPHRALTWRAAMLWLLAYLALGALYFFALRSPVNGFWYPPVALGRAALLLHGWAALPIVIVGELGLMWLQYVYVAREGTPAAAIVATATVLECIAALVLFRAAGLSLRWPARGRSWLMLALLVAVIPSFFGATLGVLGLGLIGTGDGRELPRILLWGSGNMATVVTFLPAVLAVARHRAALRGAVRRWREALEASGVLAAAVATCILAARIDAPAQDYNLKFICFLPLIWAGLRFGVAGTAVCVAVQTSAWAMLYGAQVVDDFQLLKQTLLQVQAFNLALGVGGLMLAASTARERLARRAAEDAAQRAEMASQARDRFLSVLSHELRAPLTPAMLYASSLTSDPRLPDEQRQEAGIIRDQIRAQARIIDDLLELSCLRFHGIRMNLQTIEPAKLLEGVREQSAEAAARKGVTLAGPGQEAAEARTARADAPRLKRALLAIVENAIRFTPPGGRVELSLTDAAEGVRIQVRDTGVGIPAEMLERIFEPFEQVDRTLTEGSGGLGLGLPVARGLVLAMGGKIRARSDGQGMGTTIEIELPRG